MKKINEVYKGDIKEEGRVKRMLDAYRKVVLSQSEKSEIVKRMYGQVVNLGIKRRKPDWIDRRIGRALQEMDRIKVENEFSTEVIVKRGW